MNLLPFRRRALAIIVLGFVFLTIGLSRSTHLSTHTAYTFLAICFFAIGVGILRRGRRNGPP